MARAKLKKLTKGNIIKDELDGLDHLICNGADKMNLNQELKQYEHLKKELQQLYESKGEAAIFRSECLRVKKGERLTKELFQS